MPHGPTKYESKGFCIYCGRSDVKLTDEHIVPLSLGGFHVLLKASCRDCNKITSKFELEVMRNLWGDARNSYNAPSRRKNRRKSHIILSGPKDGSKKLKVKYTDYPAPMIFYFMSRAGILQGLSETFDLSKEWKLKAIVDQKKLEQFEQKFPGQLTLKFKHVPDSFARLVAKIGYGQALTILDPTDFRPVCVPYILGEKENLSFIVGAQTEVPPPNEGMGYVLGNFGFGTPENLMIMSSVRLLANNHTPNYHVVVGDVRGRENVERVIRKIGEVEIKLISENSAADNELGNENDLFPSVWPLPSWRK